MVAEYMAVTAVLFLMFGIIWSHSSFLNLCIKTGCFVFAAWSSYALFGPLNVASTFIK